MQTRDKVLLTLILGPLALLTTFAIVKYLVTGTYRAPFVETDLEGQCYAAADGTALLFMKDGKVRLAPSNSSISYAVTIENAVPSLNLSRTFVLAPADRGQTVTLGPVENEMKLEYELSSGKNERPVAIFLPRPDVESVRYEAVPSGRGSKYLACDTSPGAAINPKTLREAVDVPPRPE